MLYFSSVTVSGQERYHSLAPMYYRGAQAAIIVYDITNRVSVHDITNRVRVYDITNRVSVYDITNKVSAKLLSSALA